ncbi:MAG: hypothetical protein WD025_09000 [Bacteriovoracaceae bacterium]
MINYQTILEIIQDFYEKATKDFLIGYHFRKIEDFDSHIPKIASFWELQLTRNISNRAHLPFNLLAAHAPLGIKKGELGRWIILFEETLLSHEKKVNLTQEEISLWMSKVHFFEERLEMALIRPSSR